MWIRTIDIFRVIIIVIVIVIIIKGFCGFLNNPMGFCGFSNNPMGFFGFLNNALVFSDFKIPFSVFLQNPLQSQKK